MCTSISCNFLQLGVTLGFPLKLKFFANHCSKTAPTTLEKSYYDPKFHYFGHNYLPTDQTMDPNSSKCAHTPAATFIQYGTTLISPCQGRALEQSLPKIGAELCGEQRGAKRSVAPHRARPPAQPSLAHPCPTLPWLFFLPHIAL